MCVCDRWRLGGVSPFSASPAVGVVGGGGAAPARFLPAGSRPPGSCEPVLLLHTAETEAGCPADPGGPAGPSAGTTVTF